MRSGSDQALQDRPDRADGRQTRQRIIGVAERHFAHQGIDAASLSEIATEAGQANKSAVQYHFGSRQGLVAEIMALHQRDIDQHRLGDYPEPAECDLEELVRSVVEPASHKLDTRSGRYYLIILPQVVHSHPEEVRRAPNPEPSRTILVAMAARLTHLPPELAGHRVAAIGTFAVDALADRARFRSQKNAEPDVDDQMFIENLIQMVLGALLAPAPESSSNSAPSSRTAQSSDSALSSNSAPSSNNEMEIP